ncbi:MAG: cobalamin-dependent protein [Acidimicrobiales bacterium]
MAAHALRADNWHVHHLGADLPAKEILAFCRNCDLDVVVLSMTNPMVRSRADALASRIQKAGTPTLVGGPGKSLDELLELARLALK